MGFLFGMAEFSFYGASSSGVAMADSPGYCRTVKGAYMIRGSGLIVRRIII
jgi:hypothetical protein